MTTRIAFYDMDRTITRRGTYAAFLQHVAMRRQRWRVILLPMVLLAGFGYALRLISRARLKTINLALMVGRRVDAAALAPLIDSYADHVLATNIHPAALDRIAADRAAGYRIILATASFRLYVDAIAARLGIDRADVIATNLVPGRAALDGPNCYGADKLVHIDRWCVASGVDRSACHIRAYSDHVSDVPMLNLAAEAFATTPSRALRALAATRGWPVLDWGAPGVAFRD
jgi:HAD superfamily hydrolase (TIGR01490 family)